MFGYFETLLGKTKEDLAFRMLPRFTLEVVRRYLRVSVEGIENIPSDGPFIMICNHSGYAGFDVVMLLNEIHRGTGRKARTVAHKLWFLGKPIAVISEKMGFIEADLNHSLEALRKKDPLVIFPEGEAGNFKPSNRRYRLQEFKRGFVRMAMISGAPIVPAVIIGAEETHINLSQIKFTKYLVGSVVPIPLNVLPLPVKWKIKFLPPETLDARPADAMDRRKVLRESRRFRHILQRTLISELRKRNAGFEGPIDMNDEDVPGV